MKLLRTTCYTNRESEVVSMAQTKEEIREQNKVSVSDYHKKLKEIKVRFPSVETCGIDYVALMEEKAKQKGFTTNKKIDGEIKAKGNINAYILDLIANDLEITNMIKGMKQIDNK